MNLQPILTPCKGPAVDLSLSVDPRNPECLQLFWGTALLQVVPRDKNSLLFRVVAGLLAGLGVKMNSLAECLDTTPKTLRKWCEVLRNGDWHTLANVFHGPGAETKLRPDIEMYVRARYRDVRQAKPGDTMPYGFREELVADVEHYWGVEVCGETLRRVFRDEDARPADVPVLAEQPESAAAGGPGTPAHGRQSGGGETPTADDTNSAAEAEGEECCASEPEPGTHSGQTRNIAPSSDAVACRSSSRDIPLLSDAWPAGPLISQHAGLFLLCPWFDQAFGSTPAIVQQTAAQILLGAVNQEQSKHIDFAGLGLLTANPARDIDDQHTLLAEQLHGRVLTEIFDNNAKLLSLRRRRIFYVDTHHKHYTGIEKLLLAWSGKHHDTLKGILMDFIHTEFGDPCFIGHFDNYYDARERFVLLVSRFRELFVENATGFVWINDRGYWGYEFLRWITESHDSYIQWEKDYHCDGWDLEFLHEGRFTLVRRRNNRTDRIKVRIRWREQTWDKFAGARRLGSARK